ncbi:hypothetical protein U5801_09010 [Lamprobacter modestohalophilus]|uniref:hypothetical protein n=1 Tax=Lamprobacter modestohalophilus TaxID=1064514 RepID=UPI002ADEEF4D|nr:hypothetical protein [Lamprobacter modestohalophilus]MEA1049947.1 hypothetical protein [Lamprobacter modestohalophilus]
MLTRLVQKHLFLVTQELDIVGDEVRVCIKSPWSEEKLTVMLTVLNPEPVIKKSRLEFTSRVNGETLISLYSGRPNTAQFNDFVSRLKQRAKDEYNAFAGLKPAANPQMLAENHDEEALDFEASNADEAATARHEVDAEKVDGAIRMLATYLDGEEIGSLMSALEALRADPQNASHLDRVVHAFSALGVAQGAVLTYAPYLGILLSDDPSGW